MRKRHLLASAVGVLALVGVMPAHAADPGKKQTQTYTGPADNIQCQGADLSPVGGLSTANSPIGFGGPCFLVPTGVTKYTLSVTSDQGTPVIAEGNYVDAKNNQSTVYDWFCKPSTKKVKLQPHAKWLLVFVPDAANAETSPCATPTLPITGSVTITFYR